MMHQINNGSTKTGHGSAIVVFILIMLVVSPAGYTEDGSVKRSPDTGDHFHRVEPAAAKISKTCSVYVPAYSHIFLSERERALLAITLSIRNVDSTEKILIPKIDYFDTKGELVDKLIDGVFALAPMATASFVIEQRDTRGGAGANFIVEWATENNARQPIIETIMAGYVGTRGLSFSSRGVELGCQPKP